MFFFLFVFHSTVWRYVHPFNPSIHSVDSIEFELLHENWGMGGVNFLSSYIQLLRELNQNSDHRRIDKSNKKEDPLNFWTKENSDTSNSEYNNEMNPRAKELLHTKIKKKIMIFRLVWLRFWEGWMVLDSSFLCVGVRKSVESRKVERLQTLLMGNGFYLFFFFLLLSSLL